MYKCRSCNRKYSEDSMKYKCDCGGIFDLDVEYDESIFPIENEVNNLSLWRYNRGLPFKKELWEDISLMEGMTPLIKLHEGLYAKADYYMPTLSFKDRGAVMLVCLAKKLGVTELAIDSSGNAATSVAAYSARAGIKCNVFVPEKTSEKKLQQIKAHGAEVFLIKGDRAQTGAAAIKYVEENNIFYASHIFNPYFYEGTKTYFYEVFEQLDFKFPDSFILPIGNGTLVMGAQRAFSELQRAGYIDKWPKIIGVQANACAPLLRAYEKGLSKVEAVSDAGTLAEGIAISNPVRGEQILEIVKKSEGEIIGIDEEEILEARRLLALKGIYVETTSAINYAAYLKIKLREKNPEFIIIPLCGAGIKSE